MRGKAPFIATARKNPGITPAYAGKSSTRPVSESLSQDHPRLCGEKCSRSFTLSFTPGSPPPMRGKEVPYGCIIDTEGITPAYAGKSRSDCCGNRGTKDHPRLCGEKPEPPPEPFSARGSPPPMRGKGGELYAL